MFHDKHRATWHRTARRDDRSPAAARPAVSSDEALEDLVRTLHDERGFASATLRNHQRSLRPFIGLLLRSTTSGSVERAAIGVASRAATHRRHRAGARRCYEGVVRRSRTPPRSFEARLRPRVPAGVDCLQGPPAQYTLFGRRSATEPRAWPAHRGPDAALRAVNAGDDPLSTNQPAERRPICSRVRSGGVSRA